MPTSRFTIAGTDYDYQTDVVRVDWEEDSDTFARVDLKIERDVRAYKAVITFETVLVAENSNATGTGAADLYDLIRENNAAGNTVSFVPDISASAPNSATPSVPIVTRGGPPQAYQTEKGADRLRRSLTIQSARWLDPSDTTTGGDKETIDDLNALDTVL